LKRRLTHEGGIEAISLSADGARLLAGGDDKTIKLWDVASGRLLGTFSGHEERVNSVAFSNDGNRFASVSRDKTLKLWDTMSGTLLRTFEWQYGEIGSVAISPDGKFLVSSALTNEGPGVGTRLLLWGAEGGRPLWTIVVAQISNARAFSPDGRHILSTEAEDVVLREAATGKIARVFRGHGDIVQSAASSPDGNRLISGSWDGTAKMWNVASGQLLRTFDGHTGRVYGAEFLADVRKVATAGGDGTIRIWDSETGQLLAMMVGGQSEAGAWLTMTGAGFFSGSQNAGDLLSVVRGLEVTRTDQVHQSLFSPDLVRETLAGDINGEVERAAKVTNLEKVLDSGPAPSVTIDSHPENSQSTTDLVTLHARLSDHGKGVGRIEWRVNGITAAVGSKPQGPGPDYAISQQLALDPGDNTIELVAYNGSNLLASPPARTLIRFTGPTDESKPTLHVLVVGIDAYIDSGWTPPGEPEPVRFKPLQLAVKDASTFGDDIKRAAGTIYKDAKVTYALDQEATRDNLDKIIRRLADGIHWRDTFILFIAGHGYAEDGRFYAIPQDYQGGPAALARKAIGQDLLQDWLANHIKAKKAIILLDTCASGALVAGHTRSRTDTPASEAALGRLHEATGRPVLTAAAAGQSAYEGVIAGSGERHGVFTWAVLDALRNADSNENGTIELSELVAHVQSSVPKVELKETGLFGIVVSRSLLHVQSARFGSRGEEFTLAERIR
jgi:WD40 repeat protein